MRNARITAPTQHKQLRYTVLWIGLFLKKSSDLIGAAG